MAKVHTYKKTILKICDHHHLNTDQIFVELKTYFPKVLSLSFEAKLDGQDVKVTTTNTLSNINSIGEITVPEEALNSNN